MIKYTELNLWYDLKKKWSQKWWNLYKREKIITWPSTLYSLPPPHKTLIITHLTLYPIKGEITVPVKLLSII